MENVADIDGVTLQNVIQFVTDNVIQFVTLITNVADIDGVTLQNRS